MNRLISFLMLAAVICFSAAPVSATPVFDMPSGSSALLMDASSEKVLFEQNSEEKVEVAGLKRLPALLAVCLAFDNKLIDESTQVTVSEEASKIPGVTAFLAPNENIDAGGLLKASVILTAGDSIFALLRSIYPGEAASLEAVNAALDGIGAERVGSSMCTDEKFSLRDIAKIGLRLSKSEAFLRYSGIYLDTLPHENASATELTNPNRLVRHYSGCFGIATGSVGSSQYSGAFIARRGTTTFFAAVAGMPDSASRFKLASELLDHGFASYRSVDIAEIGEVLGAVPVTGGTSPSVDAVTGEKVTALVPVSDAKLISEALLPESIEAPVAEGAPIGTLVIRNTGGETIAEAPIVAARSVDRAVFRDYFLRLISSWMHR